MFCNKCGNNLQEGELFCKKCGNKVESEPSAPVAPAPQYSTLQYGTPQNNPPQQGATQYSAPQQGATQYSAPQQGAIQYNPPQYDATQYNASQQGATQYNAPQYDATQYNTPQQGAMQYNAPQYVAPVPAAPKKPFPLKYILLPTGILAVAAVIVAVLFITIKPDQSVPSTNSGYEQQSPGGNTGNNNGGSNGGNNGSNTGSSNGGNTGNNGGNTDNNGGNTGSNNGGNTDNNGGNTGSNNGGNTDNNGGNTDNNNGGNNGVNTDKPFVAGGKEYNLVNAVNSSANGGTVFLFEGTLNDTAIMVIAAANGGFEYPATYNQSGFGDKMEVGVYMVNMNTGACVVGSTSSEGLSGIQITTDANMTISISGTLKSGTENISFSVNSVTTNTDMTNISDKVIAYASVASNNGSGGGGGNAGGGNQPVRCLCCSSRGVGLCNICDGDGKCHSCVDGMDHCISCNGSRICQYCRGTTLCQYCGGDGILYN